MSVKRYEFELYHCNGGEMLVSDTGDYVSYEDYAALEARCAALAAENAWLKAAHPQPFGPAMMKALDAYEKHQDETPETGMLDAFFILRDSIRVDTTSTDAFLAEVRAQGVEMMVEQCESDIMLIEPEDEEFYTLMIEHAKDFASELRKGVQP